MQYPEASTSESDDGPYEQFLAGQRQRVLGWKAMRQSKGAKAAQTADPAPNKVTCNSANPSREDEVVTELCQQLAAKAEECRQLVTRLDAMEEATSKVLSCQMQMQEKFIKVISIPLAFFYLGEGGINSNSFKIHINQIISNLTMKGKLTFTFLLLKLKKKQNFYSRTPF